MQKLDHHSPFGEKNKRVRVGFFDSGIGGLSILAQIHKSRPDLEVFYIADHSYAPYGTKEAKAVIERAMALTQLLVEQLQCDLIVVACNSATAVAIETLRENFKVPFIGVEPYINYINQNPTTPQKQKVGVLVTALTASSQRFQKLKERLDPKEEVKVYSSKILAGLVEEAFKKGGVDDNILKAIEAELNGLQNENLSTLILGCTHYPLIKNEIEKILNVHCVCPAQALAKRALTLLGARPPESQEIDEFAYMSTTEGVWKKIKVGQMPLWPTN